MTFVFGITLGGGMVQSQTTLRVRAETRIELSVDSNPGATVVSGILRDDSGTPLSTRRIVVSTDTGSDSWHKHLAAYTDSQGTFRVSLPPHQPRRFRIRARFDGGDGYGPVEAIRDIDPHRANVSLRLVLAHQGRFDLDARAHAIDIVARSKTGGRGIPIELFDELSRPLARATTDQHGTASIRLASRLLGQPGAGKLVAIARPGKYHEGARSESPIIRYRRTVLTLQTRAVRMGQPIVAGGQLSDSVGPLPERAVGLFLDDTHLATALTDANGQFSLEVGSGEWQHQARGLLQARFTSDDPGRSSALSTPIELHPGTQGSDSFWIWLWPSAALFALLALGRRQTKTAVLDKPHATRSPKTESERSATVVPRPKRYELSLRVVDHWDDRCIDEARALLTAPDGSEVDVPLGEQHSFCSPPLEEGDYSLQVRARGYMPTQAELHIPHRGEWSEAKIRLRSLREHALIPFQKLIMGLLHEQQSWATLTNRELVRRCDSSRVPLEQLKKLAEAVEEACYAPEVPSLRDVQIIRLRSEALAKERPTTEMPVTDTPA
ncbi:MAG: hypothetical protein AAF355_06270 [Myxococcota bacterium]